MNCAVTAQLISAFVFATRIVQFLFFLNPKFQASIHFLHVLCLCSSVCVGPDRKPYGWFSRDAAHFFCHYLSSEVANDLLSPVFASQISHLDRRICYYMSKSLKSFNDLTTRTNRFMHSPNFLLVFIICGILFDDKFKYQSLWFKQINASLQILTLIRLAVVTETKMQKRMRKKNVIVTQERQLLRYYWYLTVDYYQSVRRLA